MEIIILRSLCILFQVTTEFKVPCWSDMAKMWQTLHVWVYFFCREKSPFWFSIFFKPCGHMSPDSVPSCLFQCFNVLKKFPATFNLTLLIMTLLKKFGFGFLLSKIYARKAIRKFFSKSLFCCFSIFSLSLCCSMRNESLVYENRFGFNKLSDIRTLE